MDTHFGISDEELKNIFQLKHGKLENAGWAPRRRWNIGYYQPNDYYESLMNKLITPETKWIDVGGGSALFPNNETLSQTLASRAKKLVVVDPSENVLNNPYAHERVQGVIQEYPGKELFDLATLRMVAEHISDPISLVETLKNILRPQGLVVIFTVNRWSPVPIVSRLVPFWMHYPIKKIFWKGEEKDTFPTVYRMNSRNQLNKIFEGNGFVEQYFAYLDDLAIFGAYKKINYTETIIWRVMKYLGMRYPENCLLCVYQKQ